jgi:nucleoside-diphosphate-sugar epimerase
MDKVNIDSLRLRGSDKVLITGATGFVGRRTYREMMQAYAEARGLSKRLTFRSTLLTPLLAAYWVDVVTPVPSGVAHPLIEGLVNDVVCRDESIDTFIPITKTPFKEAVRIAFSEEQEGPGITGY